MVLFKRKPMTFPPPPKNLSDNSEVWSIHDTGEVFTSYDDYIRRFDWLNQKKFTDAVNGKSGLTYFQALKSETKSTTAIENVFPEVLRDPILRKVQFSTTGRMDDLVNQVYDEFKRDFFPGEDVIVVLEDGEQLEGVIREKAKFPMIRGPDGQVQRAAFSRYFVTLNASPAKEALLDDKHVRRDRKVFTKQNLRAFLKNSLQRESWIGAPWLVKEHLAIHYRLPMEIPAHLLQDARLLANRQQMLQMKVPRARGRSKHLTAEEFARLPPEEQAGYQMQAHPNPNFRSIHHPIASRVEPPKPPPVIIKYPIEDLDIAPKRNGVARPELKFFTDEIADYVRNGRRTLLTDLQMNSMGELLEVWNTLNVQCEVYVLDSFTFDDFVDAMRFSSTDVLCELRDEVHCAVLKQLVGEKGKIHITLPQMVEEESDESETPLDESEVSTPLVDVPARSTRSRLSHVDPAVENPRSPSVPTIPNRAVEMLAGASWIERLTARQVEDGGWQVILVGLLHQLSSVPHLKLKCEKILAHLAPMDGEPTQETARFQYATMDISLRISALQIITVLSVTTRAIKDFMETCSEDQTDVRKRKIEHQRERKLAMENLQIKDRERKILLPDNMPASPKPESLEPSVSVSGEGDDILETNGAGSSDPDDEAPTRTLRRGNDRKRKRDEEMARREDEARKKAEAIKAQNKQSKEFQKILRDIELLKQQIIMLEAKIAECDADLREANVQRTKVLGKDRFCNRYYWFERNGQPFGGLPSSSTAAYGYANGRIWVQGPDKMEADGFIKRTPEEQAMYRQQFGLTVPQRRRQEEGATILDDAGEWGFYDDPNILDNLIGWLDDRGERERKLRKELIDWREPIATYMEAHKRFKEDEAAKKTEVDEEPASRISTRHKTYEDRAATSERCLKWHNGMAEEQLGHLHSQNPPKPREKKAKGLPRGVATLVNRHGKPTTRQGERYNFGK